VAVWRAGSRTLAADMARRWKLGAGQRGSGKVRDLLFKARKHGLLPEATAGKPGGELTDKARAILGRDG
jgi:hypothetical protein